MFSQNFRVYFLDEDPMDHFSILM